MRDEEIKKLCKKVANDLGLKKDRIKYYSEKTSGLFFAERLAMEAFLQDKNMDSVRELRAFFVDLHGPDGAGIREPLRWDDE